MNYPKYIFALLVLISLQSLSGATKSYICYDDVTQDPIVEVRMKPKLDGYSIEMGNIATPSYFSGQSRIWIGRIIEQSEKYIVLKVRQFDSFLGYSIQSFKSIVPLPTREKFFWQLIERNEIESITELKNAQQGA